VLATRTLRSPAGIASDALGGGTAGATHGQAMIPGGTTIQCSTCRAPRPGGRNPLAWAEPLLIRQPPGAPGPELRENPRHAARAWGKHRRPRRQRKRGGGGGGGSGGGGGGAACGGARGAARGGRGASTSISPSSSASSAAACARVASSVCSTCPRRAQQRDPLRCRSERRMAVEVCFSVAAPLFLRRA